MRKLNKEDFDGIKQEAYNYAVDQSQFYTKEMAVLLSKDEVSALIFDDWIWYAQCAKTVLQKGGYLEHFENDDVFHGFEKHVAFKVFTDAYLNSMVEVNKIKLRTYLSIPFRDKERAKKLGRIFWDKDRKMWYVPHDGDSTVFKEWLPNSTVNPLKPQRNEQPTSQEVPDIFKTLYIDTIPKTAWFSNLRSEVTASEWDIIRKKTYRIAGYVCEVCGGKGNKHPVECHERWTYDEDKCIQTLVGTISLCPACHLASHYGYSQVIGKVEETRNHLMKINNWDVRLLDAKVEEAKVAWERRNKLTWTLDATWILGFAELSLETENKILRHALAAAGSVRDIASWQKMVIKAS